jgi:hypothetical protein
MAYGDYNGPDKPNKGHEGGACNRQRCQAEPALYYNHGSHSWYCVDCARDIGQDPINLRDWTYRWKPECGHDQFETREQMDAREASKPLPPPDVDKMFHEVIEPHFGWPRGRQKPQSLSLQRMLGKAPRRAVKGVR